MSNSLLEAPAVDTPSAETAEAPAWFVDEGVPGQGSKPDYLNPKYKTLAEQAKAYNELEKKLGTSGIVDVPDMYSFGELEIDAENPHIKDLMNSAKQHRISQDAFSAVVNGLAGYADSYAPKLEQELERLGPNGKQRAQEVSQWAANTLSKDKYEKLKEMAVSADIIEVLDEIRQNAYKATSQPPQGGVLNESVTPLTLKEVQNELNANFSRYNSDPKYRAELSEKFARASK